MRWNTNDSLADENARSSTRKRCASVMKERTSVSRRNGVATSKKKRSSVQFTSVGTAKKKKGSIVSLGLGRAKRVIKSDTAATPSLSKRDVESSKDDDTNSFSSSTSSTTSRSSDSVAVEERKPTIRPAKKAALPDISYIVNWKPNIAKFKKSSHSNVTTATTASKPDNAVRKSSGTQQPKKETSPLVASIATDGASTETLELCNLSACSDVEMDLSSSCGNSTVSIDEDTVDFASSREKGDAHDTSQENEMILDALREESDADAKKKANGRGDKDATVIFTESNGPVASSAVTSIKTKTLAMRGTPVVSSSTRERSTCIFRPSPQCAPFSVVDSANARGGANLLRRSLRKSVARTTNRPTKSDDDVPEEYRKFLKRDNVLYVNGTPYLGVSLIGKGGSSKVYKVFGPGWNTYALKYVQLKKVDERTMSSYRNEIDLLKKLRGCPSIIQMKSAEINLEKRVVLVVMEYGQVDLNKWLKQRNQKRLETVGKVSYVTPHDINELRLIWQQMLTAVNVIHEARIVHGDLKPANFVFVCGSLKLIDFGIAKEIESNDTTNIVRDSQVGTLNFMAPEALGRLSGTDSPARDRSSDEGMLKLSRSSDIWSLGCILYQLVYGRPPFASLSLLQKMRAILDTKHCISYPTLDGDGGRCAAMSQIQDVMKQCLQRKPLLRPPITGRNGLLRHSMLWPVSPQAAPTTNTDDKATSSWLSSLISTMGTVTSDPRRREALLAHRSHIASELQKHLSQTLKGEANVSNIEKIILSSIPRDDGDKENVSSKSRRRPRRAMFSSDALCKGKENLKRQRNVKRKTCRKPKPSTHPFTLRSSALKKKRRALQPLASSTSARFMKKEKKQSRTGVSKGSLGDVLRQGLRHIKTSAAMFDDDETDGQSWTLDGATFD